jgi:hypothetical protein
VSEPYLPVERQAVALVAEGLAVAFNHNKAWWQRSRLPFEFVPLAREAVAVLLLLPRGRGLSNQILARPSAVERELTE